MVITLKQRKNVALWDFLFPYKYRKKKILKIARLKDYLSSFFAEYYNMDISHQVEKMLGILLNAIIKIMIGKSNQ